MRFGTEITFSDPSLHGLFVDPEEKCDKKKLKSSQDAAGQVPAGLGQGGHQRVRPPARTSRSRSPRADPLSRPDARRFTFTGKTWNDTGEEIPLVSWYQTNVDNSCLELQTAPTTLGEFGTG